MEVFEITPPPDVVVEPLRVTVEQPQRIPPNAGRIMTEYYVQALSRDPADVERKVAQGMESLLRLEANGKVEQGQAQFLTESMRNAAANGQDPQEFYDQIRQSNTFGGYLVPQVTSLLEGGEMGDRERRLFDRILRAEELIAIHRENQSEGIMATVGYFGDVMISEPLHNIIGGLGSLIGVGEETFENGVNRRELAKELNDLIMSDAGYSPEEFEQKFGSILQRISNAGFFSEENPFFLDEFLTMAVEGGEGQVSQGATAFQVLDIATAGLGSAILKGAQRVPSLGRAVTRIRGRDAGEAAILRAADSGNPGMLLAGTEPSITRAGAESIFLSGPDHHALRQLEATNQAMKMIRLSDAPAFTDPRILKAKMGEAIQGIRDRLVANARNLRDVDLYDDGLGNIIGRAVMVKADGQVFVNYPNAKHLANQVGGEVVETVEGGRTAYVVVKDYNLSTEGLARATDLNQVRDNFLRAVGSTTNTTTKYLDGVLKWGESSGAKLFKEVAANYRAAYSQASKVDRSRVSAIFNELQNDPLHSWRREPLTQREFIQRHIEKFGEGPTEQGLEYWKRVGELNDADFFLNADPLLKEAVSNGETMVNLGGEFYRSKRVTSTEGRRVFDVDTQTFVDFTDDMVVYEVKDFAYRGLEGSVQYVTLRNPVERRLFHTDVMSYNVGGHRIYTDKLDYYLKQDQVLDIDGHQVTATPKTLMGVRTVQEARQAEKEWNAIAKALREENPNIDRIINENNTFIGRQVETKDEFLAFAEKHGMNPKDDIALAKDGELSRTQGGKEASWAGDTTVGQNFRNSYNNRARTDRPLIGFGGDPLRTMDPTQAMERGFASALNRHNDAAYLNQATKGLMRTIEKLEARGENHVKNWKDLQGLPLARQIAKMEFKDTDIGRKLKAEHSIIMRVLDRGNPDLGFLQAKLDAAAGFVYGRKDQMAVMLGKKNAQRVVDTTDWFANLDYAGFMRSAAFHTKLGALSPDQFFIQGLQSINAVAISSSTLGFGGAIRAASGATALQMAIAAGDDVAATIAKRQASVTGVTPENFMKIRQWIIRQGRGIVDRTVVEENRDAVIGAGVKAQVANVSTLFFRAGEVNARMAAAMLDMAEMQAKGFTGDIFSDNITRRMVSRQDILTASMTSKSAAPWQRNMLAVPLQFMTYNMRIFEQLIGDTLTASEKWRLFLTHLVVYGGAAIPGVGYMMDKYQYEGGYGAETGIFHGIRYGLMDAGLSALTTSLGGKETAYASRVAVGESLFQLMEDVGSDGLLDLAMGPGGQVIYDSLGALAQVADNFFNESWDASRYDMNRFMRIFSSYDDGFKVWAALTYGEYWTRSTGLTTMTNLNVVDAITQGLGIPLADQNRVWATVSFEKDRRKNVDKVIGQIQEHARLAARKLEDGDFAGYSELMGDIGFLIHGLPYSERRKAYQRVRQDGDLPGSVAGQIFKRGDADLARRLQGDLQ